MQLLIRARSEPLALVPRVRETLRSIDPLQPLANVRLLDHDLALSLAPRRFVLLLLATFAVAAVGLAAVGIYGVIAYMVGRRTREFGVRMALGAERKQVLAMVLGEGALLAVGALLVGGFAAALLSRFVGELLFQVSATDPATYLSVGAVLALVAVTAAYVPARRATRVDPMEALRSE
jgi:ABC-type antimicrobial peptide transport system permease subunit